MPPQLFVGRAAHHSTSNYAQAERSGHAARFVISAGGLRKHTVQFDRWMSAGCIVNQLIRIQFKCIRRFVSWASA